MGLFSFSGLGPLFNSVTAQRRSSSRPSLIPSSSSNGRTTPPRLPDSLGFWSNPFFFTGSSQGKVIPKIFAPHPLLPLAIGGSISRYSFAHTRFHILQEKALSIIDRQEKVLRKIFDHHPLLPQSEARTNSRTTPTTRSPIQGCIIIKKRLLPSRTPSTHLQDKVAR
ncbi:uncharacterized protein [Lolium perenne]|uniref:uncharacterized protein isoform X3 n=1 Tax=Lolium perenne TaxID=4522 RepID=UPI003A994642